MSTSAFCLLAYVSWCIAMGLALVSHRGLFMLNGQRRINQFTCDNKGLSDFGERMARVHGNCLENLPAVATLLLYAIATQQTTKTDPLAPWLLALRVAQSVVHMSGTREWQVWLRLICFVGQVTIYCLWIGSFLK
ncbi:MAG: MAPEG family protein [Burkholderiales bacterium]|nr:MAPEG family protein [Burkholderiales bacterium]